YSSKTRHPLAKGQRGMSTHDLAGTLAQITNAIGDDDTPGCHKCGQPVTDSPSSQFCSERCQTAWMANQTTEDASDHGRQPDQTRPEYAPTRPLTWLGTPPTGAFIPAGHEVLDQIATFINRFSAFPDEHCAPTLALWCAHTHMVDRFYVTPRIVLDS